MDQELTQRIKDIFPAHAQVINSADTIEDLQDGHAIVTVKLTGTREELDAFYDAWDATDTSIHITTTETVIPSA